MTQKYKKEEKANKYIYRVPYQKNKTLLLLLLDITIQNWGFDSGARYSLVTANAKSASSNCLLFTIYACIFREDYGTLWPARNKIAPLPSTYVRSNFADIAWKRAKVSPRTAYRTTGPRYFYYNNKLVSDVRPVSAWCCSCITLCRAPACNVYRAR